MLQSIKRHVFVPVQEDDEYTALVAKVTNSVCLSMMVFLPVLALGMLFFSVGKPISSLLPIVTLLVVVIAYGLARGGRILFAGRVLVYGLWLASTALIVLSGGISTVTVASYILCTGLAGILSGHRAATMVGVLSGLTGLGITLMTSPGDLVANYHPMQPWSDWLVLTLLLALTVSVTNVTVRSFADAWKRTSQGIGERGKSQEKAVNTEETLKGILEALPVGMLFTEDRRIMWMNEAGRLMFGFDGEEEYLEKPTAILYSSTDERERAESTLFRGQSSTDAREVETCLRRKNGNEFHARIRIALDDAIDATKRCVLAISEVSGKTDLQEALKQSEESYKNIIESLYDIYYRTDEKGIVTCVSPSVERVLGYRQDEAIGQPLRDLYADNSERERFLELIHREGHVEQFETQVKTKSGSLVWISTNARLLKDADGNLVGTEGIARDVTNKKRTEQALRESEARVRLKLESIILPEGDIGTLELADVIDVQAIQSLMDDFFSLTNIGVGIIDLKGKVLVSTGWQDLCVKFHRLHPETLRNCLESDLLLSHGIEEGSFKLYKCKNNMWDIATPITVGGKHLGNLFLGQFFFDSEVLDYEAFRSQARQYGFDEEEYIAALERVPRWSKATVETVMSFYSKFARMVSELSHRNVNLARTLTERNNLLDSLKESNRRLDAAQRIAHVGTWEWDIVSGDIFWSDELYRIFGLQPGERRPSYELARQLTHPDDTALWKEALADSLESGDSFRLDYRGLRVDGTVVWLHSEAKVERDDGGKPLRMLGTAHDITEHKRIEHELRASEERYRSIFSHSPLGIMHFNEDGVIVDFNEKFSEIIGAPREKILGFNMLESLKDEKMLEAVRSCLAGGTGFYEGDYLSVTGNKLTPMRAIYSRILSLEGTILGGVALFEDITDRRHAEQTIKDREQMLTSILSASPVGIGWSTDDRRMQWVNDAWLRIFGFQEAGEIKGHSARALYPSDEEFARVGDFVRRSLTEFRVTETEARMVRRNGAVFDARLRFRAVDPLDPQKGFIAIVDDVSEKKMAEAEQEHLRSQLYQAQKMEAVGTLAGGIAHDFNNLLQVILGYSELLLAEKTEDDPERADLRTIHQAAHSGAELVRSLLMFTRRGETKPIVMSLNRQIERTEKLLRRAIPKMIEIRLELADDLHNISADPAQMEQILMNLAVNASDAMPHGGTLKIVTANAYLDERYCRLHPETTPGEYVLLSVSDTGEGMTEETQEHMFEPFFSTKEIGRGTGLGLAMVYGIVQQHGGNIHCLSEVNSGTTFEIYFPAVRATAESSATLYGKMPAGGTETILLVDDEDPVRELAHRTLSRAGYRVLTAVDGLQALELFRENRDDISLVILDLIMPSMGGAECLAELLKIDPSVRVLIASGYSGEVTEGEALQRGARGFLGKPFQQEELLQQVRLTLDGK